jgi:hypothetical protein
MAHIFYVKKLGIVDMEIKEPLDRALFHCHKRANPANIEMITYK